MTETPARSGRHFERLAPFLATLAIAASATANLGFVLASGERAAYAGRMTADSESFLRNAHAMIAAGSWLYTPDTYHSVGASVYVAALLRLFGSVLAIKIGHVVLLTASLALFYRLGRSVLPNAAGAAAAVALLASSVLLARYCAVVQYEIVVLFLFTVLLALGSSDTPLPLVIGVLGAIAATFRVHFGLFVVFFAVDALVRARRALGPEERAMHARRAALALAGFALVALPFNVFYSSLSPDPFFFQSRASGARWLFRLNANASGAMWPYPARTEPHGVAFILEEPGLYLRWLVRKARYLVGIDADHWFVESRWVRAATTVLHAPVSLVRTAFATLYGSTAALGFLSVVASRATRDAYPVLGLAAMQVAAVLAPQLIVGSSTRVLVPIVPALLLLQLHLARLGLAAMRRARAQKSV